VGSNALMVSNFKNYNDTYNSYYKNYKNYNDKQMYVSSLKKYIYSGKKITKLLMKEKYVILKHDKWY